MVAPESTLAVPARHPTTLNGTLWVSDDTCVWVSDHDNMAAAGLGRAVHCPTISIHADNTQGVTGPDRRTADLTVLRNLGRRILIACETALADDRAKAEAGDERAKNAEAVAALVTAVADTHPGLDVRP